MWSEHAIHADKGESCLLLTMWKAAKKVVSSNYRLNMLVCNINLMVVVLHMFAGYLM